MNKICSDESSTIRLYRLAMTRPQLFMIPCDGCTYLITPHYWIA